MLGRHRALSLCPRPRSGPSFAARRLLSTVDPSPDRSQNEDGDLNPMKVVPFATTVTGTIGAIYCWSMWTAPLTKLTGVVAAAPADFTLPQVLPVLSAAAISFGLMGPFLGSWVDKAGPRMAGTVGSIAWCSSLMISAAGAHLQSLPLVYLGYGVFGGVAWGLLYLSPVSAAMKWFPDKRGFATGVTLSAFGLGAALAPPIIDYFTQLHFVAPELLGLAGQVALDTLADGSQVLAGTDTQVVVATAADAARVGLTEGVYAVGTGDSGAAGAMASLGLLYGGVGLAAAQFMKTPPSGWVPRGYEVDQTSTAGTLVGVPLPVAMYTPQFALLWMVVFGNAVGGMAIISSSKMVMMDIWTAAMPAIVTTGFATSYVAALGLANAGGRLGWALASDKIGRKNAYAAFAIGMPVIAGTPFLINMAMGSTGTTTSVLPLAVFCGGSLVAIVNYGGIFSVLPACGVGTTQPFLWRSPWDARIPPLQTISQGCVPQSP